MGFNVTALAQKARTQTIIVDSDLNMGQYDVIATDVKGDTAEFSEFVGGVGNFESGLISGGLDVSGILHAEGNTQVDGNIILEGSINNVNIADDGEITTTKGVNGADFNGAPISSNKFNGATITSTKFNGATIDTNGNVTGAKGTFSGGVSGSTATFSGAVTASNIKTTITVSSNGTHQSSVNTAFTFPFDDAVVMVLPLLLGVRYTGSIKYYSHGYQSNVEYATTLGGSRTEIVGISNGIQTISFTNAQCLMLTVTYNQTNFELCDVILS